MSQLVADCVKGLTLKKVVPLIYRQNKVTVQVTNTIFKNLQTVESAKHSAPLKCYMNTNTPNKNSNTTRSYYCSRLNQLHKKILDKMLCFGSF